MVYFCVHSLVRASFPIRAASYFIRGQIDPIIAAPVAAGVLLGATVGARILGRITSKTVRLVFVAVLVVISLEMLQKGLFP